MPEYSVTYEEKLGRKFSHIDFYNRDTKQVELTRTSKDLYIGESGMYDRQLFDKLTKSGPEVVVKLYVKKFWFFNLCVNEDFKFELTLSLASRGILL